MLFRSSNGSNGSKKQKRTGSSGKSPEAAIQIKLGEVHPLLKTFLLPRIRTVQEKGKTSFVNVKEFKEKDLSLWSATAPVTGKFLLNARDPRIAALVVSAASLDAELSHGELSATEWFKSCALSESAASSWIRKMQEY